MKPSSKHMEWAASFFAETGFGDILENCDVSRHKEALAQHLAAFEAEVREDMAETHVDKADAWDATIRAGKKRTDAHGWRTDMENAPRDGTVIDLIANGERITNARYRKGRWEHFWIDDFDGMDWCRLDGHITHYREITLPAQPEKEGE